MLTFKMVYTVRVPHETSAVLYVRSGQQPRASTVSEKLLKIYSLTTCNHKEIFFFNHFQPYMAIVKRTPSPFLLVSNRKNNIALFFSDGFFDSKNYGGRGRPNHFLSAFYFMLCLIIIAPHSALCPKPL